MNGPLTWSLLFIIVAVIAVVVALPALLGAIFSPGTGQAAVDTTFAELMTGHEDSLATYQARFNGRSVFFKPPQPPPAMPARTPDPTPVIIETPPTGIPATPSSYTGPTIRALIGDTVWFHGGLRVTAGEEAEGVRVISVNAPWSATVAYAGGEYDVSLFENLTPFFRDPDSDSSTLPPGLIEADSEEAGSIAPLRFSPTEEGGGSAPGTVPKPPRRPPDVPPE
jgi:hypothetical protein